MASTSISAMRGHAAASALIIAWLLLFATELSPVLQAQTFKTLHIFHQSSPDGDFPQASLVQGTDGSFYGTTQRGGTLGAGIVFKLDPTGNFMVLHAFDLDLDGGFLNGALIRGSDGSFYGTTAGQGPTLGGTVFKVDATGNYSIVHAFDLSTEGAGPNPLVQGSDGYFYGITNNTITDQAGSLFRMDTAGNVTRLHVLNASVEGGRPTARLVQGSDGFLYGTTSSSGAKGNGTIFKADTAGNVTVLHAFDPTEGTSPTALIQGSDGYFYGALQSGGTWGNGSIFKIDAAGNFTLLHAFEATTEGASPSALMQGSNGYFYGTTSSGGTFNLGAIFRMDSAGNVTVMHTFAGSDGANPQAGLIQASDGYFYGTTRNGGTFNFGTIFQMDSAGNLTVVHSIGDAPDGALPYAGLIQGSDGNLYGTTLYSVSGPGTVFRYSI